MSTSEAARAGSVHYDRSRTAGLAALEPRLGVHSTNWCAELAAERANLATAVLVVIIDYMDCLGISQAELAQRMGVSSSRVGKILSGGENLTLRSLATVAAALHARFDLTLRARGD
jgi:antitoxin component HigA of HigAB toxin-antitoxin module